jgi:hypothetical protein
LTVARDTAQYTDFQVDPVSEATIDPEALECHVWISGASLRVACVAAKCRRAATVPTEFARTSKGRDMKKDIGCGFFLPASARKELQEAKRQGGMFLDDVIKRLRVEYPEAFHTDKTLPERRFALKPVTDETPHSVERRYPRHDHDTA